MSFLSALALGLLIGAQHAFEPDHLAAMSTMLPGEKSFKRAAARGAWWGLGHGAAIAAIGLPLIVLGLTVPESLEGWAEFAVAVMLVALGVRALLIARKKARVTHDGKSLRALPIGLLHGLAGSGGAVILATASAPSTTSAVIFLVVFVMGSTLSMMLTTGALSLPLGRLAAQRALLIISGLISIVVGVLWGGPHVVSWF